MDKILKTAVVFGATGLTGRYLREELNHDYTFGTVILAARSLSSPLFEKEQYKQIDFDQLPSYNDLFHVDVIFCCLGTTIKKVGGNQEAFRKIDEGYPVQIAELSKTNGVGCFVVISSMGANSHSRIFYNKVKGDMEEGVKSAGVTSTYILRPSLLMGDRKENRAGEKLAQWVLPVFSPLLVGRLKDIRPIHGLTVAKAMLRLAKEHTPGCHIYSSQQLKEIAAK